MAQMQCKCGNRLSNVCCPNLMEGKICGLYEYQSKNTWECRICGRLYIDLKDETGLTYSKSYIPENNEVGKLFDVAGSKEFVEFIKELKRNYGTEILHLYADPNYYG